MEIPNLIDHDGARGPIPGCDCDLCKPPPGSCAVSAGWVLNQLAGMRFASLSGLDAYDYMKAAIEAAPRSERGVAADVACPTCGADKRLKDDHAKAMAAFERMRVAAIGRGFPNIPISNEEAVAGELARLRTCLAELTRSRDESLLGAAAATEQWRREYEERMASLDGARVPKYDGDGAFLSEESRVAWLADELAKARSGWTRSSSLNVDARREADAEKLARIAAIRERDEARAELAKVKAAHADLKATVAAVTRSHGGGG